MNQARNDSPALLSRSPLYPVRYAGKVPSRVRMLKTVSSDIPFDRTHVLISQEYDVWVNSHGAVSAILEDGQLGLKSDEFEVIAWHREITDPRDYVCYLAETENGVTPSRVANALNLAGPAEATRWLEACGFETRFNDWRVRGDWVWFPAEGGVMEEPAEYTLDLALNTPARVDALWQSHYQLSLNLEHLLYRQFRADLPATFKPALNRPGADRFLKPLPLTPEERKDLAGEIHREMFGEVPEWLKVGLLKIKAERESRENI